MYIIGFTRSCPVLAPTVCRSSSGAPSNGPPTLPSLARNSSMILLFQSDISGTLILLSSTFAGLTARPQPMPCATRQPQPHAGSFPRRKERAGPEPPEPPEPLGAPGGWPRAPGGLPACAGRAGGAALAQLWRLDRAAAVGL